MVQKQLTSFLGLVINCDFNFFWNFFLRFRLAAIFKDTIFMFNSAVRASTVDRRLLVEGVVVEEGVGTTAPTSVPI